MRALSTAHGVIEGPVRDAERGLLISDVLFGAGRTGLSCCTRPESAHRRTEYIVEGDDIAGDGVNVAARLEALAEPGGICVSVSVREQVHGNVDVGFDDIGEQQVKNIMRPIRVFAVALDAASAHGSTMGHAAGASSRMGSVASTARHRLPLTKNTSMAAAVGVIALVIGGSTFLWWNSRSNAPPAPPAMSVGVMPLVASSGDAAIAQRAEAWTRDLTSMLVRTDPAIRQCPYRWRRPRQRVAAVSAR